MKKLMVAVVSAASAIFAFGDLPHGANFEAVGYTPGTSITNYLDKADDATDDGNSYWSYTGEEDIGSIAEHANGVGPVGVDVVPDIYSNAVSNAKFLQLDSGKSRLVRNIASDGSGVSMATGDGIYLDTLVKFTPASSLIDDDFESGDKLAIAYIGDLEDGNEVTVLSNLVIRAGFIGESQPTNYLAYLPETKIDVDDWHRLTIRTLTNIDGNNRAGFKIYIDGTNLVYFTDKDNFAKSAGFVDDTHTIFPSALAAGQTNADTISAVAFSGNGGIDDVVFTTTTPKFITDTELVVATFTKDAGVTGISVQVGSGDPIVVDMNELSATLPPGTSEFTVTATINEAEDYEFARMTYGDDVFTTNPATITGYTGGAIAITTTRNNFNVFDENGDPISGTFQTFAEALAAQGVAKIQLTHGYDALAVEGEDFEGYSIAGEVTLDLAGNDFDGGDDTAGTSLFTVSDTFTIIDSVGGGKVIYDTNYGYAIVKLGGSDAFIGAATGDEGASFDGKLFEDDFEGTIIKGNIDAENNSTAGVFDWAGFVDQNSTCGDTPVSGYWVVAPQQSSDWPQPAEDTPEAVETALEAGGFSTDTDVVTTKAEYADLIDYVEEKTGASKPADLSAAQKANAVLCYALQAPAIPTAEIVKEDVTIDAIETGDDGAVDLTVAIDGVTVGAYVPTETLAKIVTAKGGVALGSMSTENVNVSGHAVETGKVKITVTPKAVSPTSFFTSVIINK